MASITTRAGKGSPLTNAEVDANFTNLNTELGQKLVGNQNITFSGDATGSGATSVALTLASSGVVAGTYGSATNIPQFAVDAKGRITSVSNVAVSIPSGSLTFTGDVTGTGSTGSSTALTLANSGITAGTYTKVTFDAKGRATSGTTLSSADLPTYTGTLTSSQVTTALGFTPYNSTNPSGYITSSALSSYLPLSGGTLTGASTVAVSTWEKWTLETTGVTARARQGSDANGLNFTSNARWTGSAWAEDDSTRKKFAYIQHLGNGRHEFRTAPTGAGVSWTTSLTVDESAVNSTVALQQGGNQVVHAGNVSTYALPIGGGTTTGTTTLSSNFRFHLGSDGNTALATFRLNTSSRNLVISAPDTGALFLNWDNGSGGVNFGNGAQGVVGSVSAAGNASFNGTLNAVGAVTQNGSQVLHAGNFSSYALPLSGGTISGQTRFTGHDNQVIIDGTTNGASSAAGLFFALQGSLRWENYHFNGALRWYNYTNASEDFSINNSTSVANFRLTPTVGGSAVLHAGNYSSYALPAAGGTISGVLSFPQNPVGTTYGNGVSATPSFRIEGGAGNDDGWRIYGESASTNSVSLVFEVIDDIETAGNEWIFRNKKTYGDYAATTPLRISGAGAAFIAGNTVLHAGNYTSYSPTLTGGGASGTWGINVTGSAGSAGWSTYSQILDTRAGQYSPNAYEDYRTTFEFTNQITGLGDWHTAMTMQGWHNGYAAWQIIGPASTSAHENWYLRSGINTSWNSARAILHSGNYTSYSPSLTGSGASGTWGINISGNAASANNVNSTQPNIGYSLSGVNIDYGGQGGPQVQSQGGGAAMVSFHRPNAYAINFGLGTDNQLRTGGWSRGGNYVILDSGNYSSYALPLSGGTVEGTANVRTSVIKQYQYVRHIEGKNWDNYDTAASGLYLNYASNQPVYIGSSAHVTLHAGNYSSYALPLSGGTVSGSTTFNSAVNVNGRDIRPFENDSFKEFYVGGDANTYYPVRFDVYAWFHFGRWSISRGYGDTAPWDPIGTGAHRGGLTLTWEWSGDGAWGGNDKTIRVIQFSEQYTTMVGGMALSVNGIIVWLRGGNAYYRFHGPGGSMNGATPYYSTFTASNGSTFSPRSYNSATVASEVTARMPVRGESEHWDGGNRVLHAGNYSSYAVPQSNVSTSGGASVVLKTESNGYLYLNNWLHVASGGLFSSVNSAHFYPNNTEYGSWRIAGSRLGWHGIYFDSGANLMMNSNEVGFHRAGAGWMMRWLAGTGYVHKGDPGGGTSAAILDSSNYTSYSPPYSGGTLTGTWYFLANRNTSSDSPALQAYSTGGNGAIMSFHRGGHYAINMGLDSDNVFRIGGWSASTNRLQMDMSGNLTMAGNVTAYSDERLKKDWASPALDFVQRLAQIKSGTYTRIDSEERQAGASAQDWQALLPEVVSQDNEGYMTLAYGNAAVVSAIELAKDNLALRARIDRLEALVEKLIGD